MALGFPRWLFAEMYFPSLGWTDITSSVLQTRPVVTVPGRASEQGKVPSTKCSMNLDNDSGNFSPSNPMGDYFGQLGNNTPIQHGFKVVEAGFGTTVSNAWPAADTGEAWTLSGTAADFDSAAGVGTMTIAAASTTRTAWLDYMQPFVHYELTTKILIPYPNGDNNTAGHTFRDDGTGVGYARSRLQVSSAGAVTVFITDGGGSSLGFHVVDTVSAGWYYLRTLVEGDSIRTKAWAVGDPVPYEWQIEASVDGVSSVMNASGRVGLSTSTGVGASNVTVSYDDYSVRIVRFCGLVADLRPRWDESQQIHWVELEASGIMRSLIQGQASEASSLRRGLEDEIQREDPYTAAYWPCEDGKNADSVAALAGQPMTFTGGPPGFADDDTFACSQPIVVLNGATLTGAVPYYDSTATGQTQVRHLIHIPSDGESAPQRTPIMYAYTTGSIGLIELQYDSASQGEFLIAVWNQSMTFIGEFLTAGMDANGVPGRVSVDITQDGADVDIAVVFARVATDINATPVIGVAPFTFAGQTCGRVTRLVFNPTGFFQDTSIGHVVVQADLTLSEDMSDELAAWAGETAVARFLRLTGQNNIPARVVGAAADSARMGVQLPGPLLDLLQECADADLGTLGEDRSHNVLVLRALYATYGQDPALTLDYSGEQVSPPFQPMFDDRIRNKVIAKRLRGSQYQAVQTSGPKNVNPSWEDPQGVGPYEHEFTVNVHADSQLQNTAGVVKAQGTVDEERYPKVTVVLGASGFDTAASAAVLAVGVDDRVVVENLTEVRVYQPVDQIARGYTETLNDEGEHVIAFNTTPYDPYRVGVWDDGVTRYDSSTSTLNTGIDDNDMSLSVAFTGSRWTTDAGYFPMQVMVGPPGGKPGELLVISAISGTTSPQTFTVTDRGLDTNGVVRSWPAGSEVHVYSRTRWAR